MDPHHARAFLQILEKCMKVQPLLKNSANKKFLELENEMKHF